MKNNINYRLRKLSHGLSGVGIVAVMLGTTVPFSTANVSDTLNLEHVAQAAETNEDYEKTYDIVYLGDIELPFKEQEVKAAIVQNGQVVKDPVEEVVKVGTQKTIKTTVPFETEYKVNDELKDGEQKVVQKGKNGVKETWEFYKVNTSTGEIGEKTSENPPKYISNDDKPVKEIIEINSKTLSEIENGQPPVPPKQDETDDKEQSDEQSNEQSDEADKEKSDEQPDNKSDEQSDEQNKDKEIKVDIGKPYMPKEIEEKQSIEEKQNEPSLNKEDDETIIKENESEQSPSERDSNNNNATEKVHDSSDVTKEQKQGQPELAETGIQKESNRLALLGIAGIGIVIAGLFFFISRKDKK